MNNGSKPFDRFWRSKSSHPERYGQACRIVGSIDPSKNLVTIEFSDGVRIIGSAGAIRLRSKQK